jgi:hypothetical protein
MAFCPNCGKAATEQATKCVACGQEFEGKAKPARFKGTMMMAPGTAPAEVKAALEAAPPAEPPAAAPVAAAPPPAAAAAAPKASLPGGSHQLKATMLGTGGAGFAPPRPSAAAGAKPALPEAPPPAASIDPPAPAPVRPHAPDALADTTRRPAEPPLAAGDKADDSQRFLVGDPMAPAHAAPRMTDAHSGRDAAPKASMPTSIRTVLAVGVGGILAILIVGYCAARYLGLLH